MLPDKQSHTMRQVTDHRLLTPEEEIKLGRAIQGKNKKAAQRAVNELVRHNMRLATKIAGELNNPAFGIETDDLVSEGAIGLHTAASRFNPCKGAKFSTYASWWVRQRIARYIANHGRTIRLPVHLLTKMNQVRRIQQQLTLELGREPGPEEIAEATGLTEKAVAKLLATTSSVSLQTPLGEESAETLENTLEDTGVISPAEAAIKQGETVHAQQLVKILPKREAEVIAARYGLGERDPETLEEIGQRLGVTRERVRQLQNMALKKMRRTAEKNPEYKTLKECALTLLNQKAGSGDPQENPQEKPPTPPTPPNAPTLRTPPNPSRAGNHGAWIWEIKKPAKKGAPAKQTKTPPKKTAAKRPKKPAKKPAKKPLKMAAGKTRPKTAKKKKAAGRKFGLPSWKARPKTASNRKGRTAPKKQERAGKKVVKKQGCKRRR